jgi:molybdopterin molybdotransferase
VSIGPRLTHFLRAIVTPAGDGIYSGRLTGPQGSGILTSMARANALLIVPEDRKHTEKGQMLNALLLNEGASLSSEFRL